MRGANIPAIIRGSIAVAWYGIQTYLASAALDVVLVRLFDGLAPYGPSGSHSFLGLSALGWGTYALLWVLQAGVFWMGMESIRRFIDFCGPAVYVVMFALCGYLLHTSLARVAQPVVAEPDRLERRRHHVLGDRAGRLLLLRPDAELR